MKKLLSTIPLVLALSGAAFAGSIGDTGGFSGGAASAGSPGGATSTLNSPVTITPVAGGSQLNFAPPWELLANASAFELFDTAASFVPILCDSLPGPGIDNCHVVGDMSFQNATGGQIVMEAPSSVSGGFRDVKVPPAAVAGGYWFDSAGDGVLTENVPILTATSASLNHGGVNITANSCENESATTVTGTTTGMDCTASPTADPGTAFTWAAICGSGTVTIRICNVSAAGATPTTSTYNIRVIK